MLLKFTFTIHTIKLLFLPNGRHGLDFRENRHPFFPVLVNLHRQYCVRFVGERALDHGFFGLYKYRLQHRMTVFRVVENIIVQNRMNITELARPVATDVLDLRFITDLGPTVIIVVVVVVVVPGAQLLDERRRRGRELGSHARQWHDVDLGDQGQVAAARAIATSSSSTGGTAWSAAGAIGSLEEQLTLWQTQGRQSMRLL